MNQLGLVGFFFRKQNPKQAIKFDHMFFSMRITPNIYPVFENNIDNIAVLNRRGCFMLLWKIELQFFS